MKIRKQIYSHFLAIFKSFKMYFLKKSEIDTFYSGSGNQNKRMNLNITILFSTKKNTKISVLKIWQYWLYGRL